MYFIILYIIFIRIRHPGDRVEPRLQNEENLDKTQKCIWNFDGQGKE